MVNLESFSDPSRRDRVRVHASCKPGGSKDFLRSQRDNLSSICLKLVKKIAHPPPTQIYIYVGKSSKVTKASL